MINPLINEVTSEIHRLNMLEFDPYDDEFLPYLAVEYVADLLTKYKSIIDLNENAIEIEDIYSDSDSYIVIQISYYNEGRHREYDHLGVSAFIEEFITPEKVRQHTINCILND